jgi:hypothetical protein
MVKGVEQPGPIGGGMLAAVYMARPEYRLRLRRTGRGPVLPLPESLTGVWFLWVIRFRPMESNVK